MLKAKESRLLECFIINVKWEKEFSNFIDKEYKGLHIYIHNRKGNNKK